MGKLRFGIVGTGTIAHRFAEAIKEYGSIEKEPTFSGGRVPSEGSSEEDTPTGGQQNEEQ